MGLDLAFAWVFDLSVAWATNRDELKNHFD